MLSPVLLNTWLCHGRTSATPRGHHPCSASTGTKTTLTCPVIFHWLATGDTTVFRPTPHCSARKPKKLTCFLICEEFGKYFQSQILGVTSLLLHCDATETTLISSIYPQLALGNDGLWATTATDADFLWQLLASNRVWNFHCHTLPRHRIKWLPVCLLDLSDHVVWLNQMCDSPVITGKIHKLQWESSTLFCYKEGEEC